MASSVAAPLSGRDIMGARRISLALINCAIALIAIFGLAVQLIAYPNHDVAWILWGTREMLGGASFGRNIIEPNPPLAWYLCMPSTWLADLLGLPIAAAFEFAVGACAAASLVAFHRLASPQLESDKRYLPTMVAAIFLFVLIGRDFGQREHLLLIAVLPYLALTAARSTGTSVSRSGAIAIGITAAIGLALKPYFLAVPLLVEVTGVVLTRRLAFPLRWEVVAMVAAIASYGVSILFLNRDYLAVAIPLATSIYWSFDFPIVGVLLRLALPSIALAVLLLLLPRKPLTFIFAAATAGFVVSCLVQHKGYSYHLYPVLAGSSLAFATLLAGDARTFAHRIVAWVLLIAIVSAPAEGALTWWKANSPSGSRTIETRRLVATVDRYSKGGGFFVVAVHPFPAFPTALYTRAHYVSRTNSQWFLPAVVQSRMKGEPDWDAERLARDFALRDLRQHPNVVLVDTDSKRHTMSVSNFDFVSFYREDPRLTKAWLDYREVGRAGSFRIFVRHSGGA